MTLRFGDLDAVGHLNNVALLRFIESGRVDFMVDVKVGRHDELSFVLASLHCDFRAQGFYRDQLVCGTRMANIGRTSMTMEQRVWRADETVVAEARSVMVALGPDRKSPAPVPRAWRDLLENWEERSLDRGGG